MAEHRRSRISIIFIEDLVQNKDTGDFYWKMRPVVSRHDYKPANAEKELIQQITKQMAKKLGKIPPKGKR